MTDAADNSSEGRKTILCMENVTEIIELLIAFLNRSTVSCRMKVDTSRKYEFVMRIDSFDSMYCVCEHIQLMH